MTSDSHFPVRLTQAQRKVVAEIIPDLAGRLKLAERNQRTIRVTLTELKAIKTRAGAMDRTGRTGMERHSLRHVADITAEALERFQGFGVIPVAERVFQFKIALLEAKPPIWRRIQVKDCTLDKLHEHIQTAMGWTNSHLHDFKIGEKEYGDPLLMEENFEEFGYEDSTTTKLSAILPKSGKRFRFEYRYDYGDDWRHEVRFEGALRAEPGGGIPSCLEGARACPPEDVGGVRGYEEFVEAMRNPRDERHEEYRMWIGGQFDPERFDAAAATRRMRRGLPDWRRMD